jgi:hypothetical protein
LALKIRPTTVPSAIPAKSSSLHSPDGREGLLLSNQEPPALVLVQVKQLDGHNLGSLAIGRFD